jgi:ABC-type maltose transport system permease subunit
VPSWDSSGASDGQSARLPPEAVSLILLPFSVPPVLVFTLHSFIRRYNFLTLSKRHKTARPSVCVMLKDITTHAEVFQVKFLFF